MPNEVRKRCSNQISFEKLCEVVDYREKSSAEDNFANKREQQVPPLGLKSSVGMTSLPGMTASTVRTAGS